MGKYPVYVISKGRSDCCLTANFLLKDNVPFRLVIEPQEEKDYIRYYDKGILEILPFSNLGLGSIPARNWVFEHAKEHGHEKHWILDDNIRDITSRIKKKRIRCNPEIAFSSVEAFVDCHNNILMSGLNYNTFASSNKSKGAYTRNCHVYSCILLDCGMPFRWRGRYNEDTDLCLQILSNGFCTCLFSSFLATKVATMTMKGGNMETLYKDDGRLRMAESLARLWPGVVKVKRRFGRPQHYVPWQIFNTPFILKEGIKLADVLRPYNLRIEVLKEIKSVELRQFVEKENSSK